MAAINNAVRSVLIIQTAFLGDIVLTSSFLRELRKILPSAQITLLTTPLGKEILTPNPWGVDFIVYDKKGKERGFAALMRKLGEARAVKPDLVFCLHRSVRSGVIARWSGAPAIWGFKEASGHLFYTDEVSRAARVFEAEKNLQFLEARFGIPRGGLSPYPELFCDERDRHRAAELVGSGEYAVLAPSSVWVTKRWPADRFGELAAKIAGAGLRVAVASGGSRDELAVVEELQSAFEKAGGDSAQLVNLAGKTSLGVLKAVLASAKFAVCNDSAPLHIAIATGRPGVAVFGPTVKSQGFFPLAKEPWEVMENLGLDCRPCGEHGHNRCPKEHFRCMLQVSVDQVFDRVSKIWQQG